MILQLLQICNGIVTLDPNQSKYAILRHTDTGTCVYPDSPRGEGYKGNITWYQLGRGAQAEGFTPQSWVAKVDGKWYLRITGAWRNKSRAGGAWSTTVICATEEEAAILNVAEMKSLPRI